MLDIFSILQHKPHHNKTSTRFTIANIQISHVIHNIFNLKMILRFPHYPRER